MTMNALIVGGAGFVGANLARACLRAGMRVTVVDSLEPRLRATLDGLRAILPDITFVQLDMRDPELARVVVDKDVVFNCAGQTSHPISMKQPVFDAELNCLGHLALLETMRTHNPDAVVVYTSTSSVVGKATGTVDESQLERPLDIYSASKLAAEKYYRIYHTAHGLKTLVLRFPNIYGPFGKGFPEFGFVNYFIHLAWSRDEIKIFGRGEQMRNLLHVDDVCDAMLSAARDVTQFGDPLFAAHDDHVSVREIAEQIIAVFGRGRLTHVEWPEDRKRIEIDDVSISSARLRAACSWRPTLSLRHGLERTKQALEAAGV